MRTARDRHENRLKFASFAYPFDEDVTPCVGDDAIDIGPQDRVTPSSGTSPSHEDGFAVVLFDRVDDRFGGIVTDLHRTPHWDVGFVGDRHRVRQQFTAFVDVLAAFTQRSLRRDGDDAHDMYLGVSLAGDVDRRSHELGHAFGIRDRDNQRDSRVSVARSATAVGVSASSFCASRSLE